MNEVRYRKAEQRLWESLGATPTERFLQLDRTGVTVRVQEIGEGPPVLFVHGGSISGASWAPLVARLEGFRCVLLDRPGCGLSAPLLARFNDMERLGAFADALVVDVLDALRLERTHLVATSFGGYMAFHAAAAHPDRIDRMVEFGWPIGAPIGRVPLAMRLGAVPGAARLMTAIPPNPRAVRMILRSIGLREALEAGRISQEGLDWFLSLLRDTDTMRNELQAAPRIIHPVRGMNHRVLMPASLLARIEAPVHFLWGEKDPYGGAAIAREFVKRIPNAELELMPGAGHAVWMDDADHAASTTRRFLQGGSTSPAT